MLVDVNTVPKSETSDAVATKPPTSSTLNPYAPSFFPSAFIETEDFSPKWWNLVQNSPDFRDYWLLERLQYVEEEELTSDDVNELEAIVDFIDQESLASDDDFEESVDHLLASGMCNFWGNGRTRA
ncbi:hypothetical protein O6H91_04G011400 [Diphasiastrum complanatum]|uniref:Uncharacterized protein n=1 Tax=Diphasiastrum complanatum TaxID=34168 RepID=A0ACC2DU85_DIPCM|nr:hypothetical protein O6H91_04G011400 [Diphasiastrum complanatum]